jgi:hypothetical protein
MLSRARVALLAGGVLLPATAAVRMPRVQRSSRPPRRPARCSHMRSIPLGGAAGHWRSPA